MSHFAIIGCGAWALSIANIFNENKHQTSVWCHDSNIATQINKYHKLSHLPNLNLHPHIQASTNLTECIHKKAGIIIGVASPFINIVEQFPPNTEAQILILTKGFCENKKSPFIFDYIQTKLEKSHISVLSGPNLAQEISEKKPAATVIASQNIDNASFFQQHLSNDYFRVYTSSDLTGVTLGGILKNTMAIAGGCIDGLNLGMNSKAAFLSRSLQEIIRIGCFLGGKKETFYGLSGLGDLITTANSSLSRNWKVGNALAKGNDFLKDLKKTGSIAEGIKTCKFMYELCQKNNIEAPITNELYAMLFQNKDPHQAIKDLMNRKLKAES